MNEKGKNKREWIKTVAICFLIGMLVLTFFSNTIMNYSLPEVATQYVQSGTITAKIRGTGQVESGDPYEVVATQGRKVLSVAVHVGDKVKKGDVLLYLEDQDSEELKEAKAALEEAEKGLKKEQDAYEKMLLVENVTSTDINDANKGVTTANLRNQITAKQKEVTDAENALKPHETKVAEVSQQIKDFEAQITYEEDMKSTAKLKRDTAQLAVTAATNELTDAQAERTAADDALNGVSSTIKTAAELQTMKDNYYASYGRNVEDYDAASPVDPAEPADYQAWYDANEARNAAVKRLETATANVDKCTKALNDATKTFNQLDNSYVENTISQTIANLTKTKHDLELALYVEQKELAAAKETLDQKKKELTELVATIGDVVGLEDQLERITEAKKLVEAREEDVAKEQEKVSGATITAGIDGTVSEIKVLAGHTFQAKDTLVELQPEGKGYTLSFSVTNEQAKRVSVGDKADLINAWRYDDITVTLASIKPDKSNPNQQKELIFDVTGDVVDGQTLNLTVGQKSATFDLIVPNSAIREDANGKFVLVVEAKPSPLSTRYIATRVDVEVIASDETQSAVTGGLYGNEYVITTSNTPVEAGKQVRLADN